MHILISALSRFTQPTGICRHAANLARCLRDLPSITKVTLLVGQWQGEYFQTAFDIKSRNIDVVPIDIANNPLARNRWFGFGLPQVAMEYKPAIVHLGFPVPILRSSFACPVVATVHDLYPYDFPESFSHFNGFCKRVFIRQCLRACDAVTCVSETTRGTLVKRFPWLSARVPIQLVQNYADFPQLADALPIATDPRPFLLTVAQHQPNKRLDLLLLAFALLREQGRVNNDLQLLVVGSEGAQSEALRRLAKSRRLGDCVRWLPPLSDGQLAWTYRNCEAFIASSCIEGFCLPLLEALFFNCRLIASDIAIFREIAGDLPVYFDISSAPIENLSGAIVDALNTPRRTTRPLLRFSRENTAAECLALYWRLLPKIAGGGGAGERCQLLPVVPHEVPTVPE